jgi:hypothetical protein
MSVDALVGEEGDIVFNSECDREPVKGFEDWGDVNICAPSSGSWQRCFVCTGASGCSC